MLQDAGELIGGVEIEDENPAENDDDDGAPRYGPLQESDMYAPAVWAAYLASSHTTDRLAACVDLVIKNLDLSPIGNVLKKVLF